LLIGQLGGVSELQNRTGWHDFHTLLECPGGERLHVLGIEHFLVFVGRVAHVSGRKYNPGDEHLVGILGCPRFARFWQTWTRPEATNHIPLSRAVGRIPGLATPARPGAPRPSGSNPDSGRRFGKPGTRPKPRTTPP